MSVEYAATAIAADDVITITVTVIYTRDDDYYKHIVGATYWKNNYCTIQFWMETKQPIIYINIFMITKKIPLENHSYLTKIYVFEPPSSFQNEILGVKKNIDF